MLDEFLARDIASAPIPTSLHRNDAQGRVMRDILGYFRTTRADAGDAFSFPLFDQHIMRYYVAQEKDAFERAVDALAMEGLVERRGDMVYLTPSGKQASAHRL